MKTETKIALVIVLLFTVGLTLIVVGLSSGGTSALAQRVTGHACRPDANLIPAAGSAARERSAAKRRAEAERQGSISRGDSPLVSKLDEQGVESSAGFSLNS